MLNHGGLYHSQSSNMDLEPSAPYASASSFPSPAKFSNGEQPSLAYEKPQQVCDGGTSSLGSLYSKFPFAVPSSIKGLTLGIDVISKLFPSPPLPQSFQPSAPYVTPTLVEKHPFEAYFLHNKIAYQTPKPGMRPTSTLALQGILQKYGIGTPSASLDCSEQVKQHQDSDSLAHPTSSSITKKIKNLDDMLRSLERYSAAKRLASDVRRESDTKTELNPLGYRHPKPLENSETHLSAQAKMGTFGGCKALSGPEFKAQVDKLTGVIEDRWFYGGVKNVKTKGLVAKESSLSENADLHPTQQNLQTSQADPPNLISNAHLMEETLRRIVDLERRLTKTNRQKQSKKKDLDSRGQNVKQPTRKRMTSILRRKFKRRASSSINQRLDKNDLAINSLKRQIERLFSSILTETTNNEYNGDGNLEQLVDDDQAGSFIKKKRHLSMKMLDDTKTKKIFVDGKLMDEHDTISRNIRHINDELCILKEENHHTRHSFEKIQKLYTEQNMEIELCWAALNHLVIDNNHFRDELQAYHKSSQKQPDYSHEIHTSVMREMPNADQGQINVDSVLQT